MYRRRSVQYGFHCAHIHEIHNNSTYFWGQTVMYTCRCEFIQRNKVIHRPSFITQIFMVDGNLVQHVSTLVTDIIRHYSLQTPAGKILVCTIGVEIIL